MAKQTKKAAAKTVTVLVRYYIKKDYEPKGLHEGDIVLYIENEAGKRYYTTLRRNKAHSCSCAGNAKFGRRCYHIDNLVLLENSRYTAKKASKASQHVEKSAQPVIVSPVPIKQEPAYTMPADKLAKLTGIAQEPVVEQTVASDEPAADVVKDNVVDLGMRGSLNGNKGFSLLKVS